MVDETLGRSVDPSRGEGSAPPSWEITSPTKDDIPVLLDLWKEQYDFHHDADPVYYAPFSDELRAQLAVDLEETIESENSHMLVARSGEGIIGFITFEQDEDTYYDANIRKFGVIKEVVVTDKVRSSGAGTALITAVEQHFVNQGVNDMSVWCSTSNPGALKFYRDKGYIPRQEIFYKKLVPEE